MSLLAAYSRRLRFKGNCELMHWKSGQWNDHDTYTAVMLCYYNVGFGDYICTRLPIVKRVHIIKVGLGKKKKKKSQSRPRFLPDDCFHAMSAEEMNVDYKGRIVFPKMWIIWKLLLPELLLRAFGNLQQLLTKACLDAVDTGHDSSSAVCVICTVPPSSNSGLQFRLLQESKQVRWSLASLSQPCM